jgi:hypothetical protein
MQWGEDMTRRIPWLPALLVMALPGASAQATQKALPNIVVILADDLGYGDPGCYNKASRIPTPNIDRLAGEGMRFTDAHTPASVCTPTRYGLLTRRYPWRSSLKRSVLDGYSSLLIEPGRLTLAIRQGPWRLAPALGSHGFSEPRTVAPRPGGPRGELYRLDRDHEERTNLWLDEPQVVRRLSAQLERYQAEGRSRLK